MQNFNDAKIPIKVQKRSGFDKSYFNLLTAKVGTIVPILVDEVIPNTTVNIRQAISLSMPPLASDAYMKVDLRCEAFFVPSRLLYGGFEKWFTDSRDNVVAINGQFREITPLIPVMRIMVDDDGWTPVASRMFAGSLADYLGVRSLDSYGSAPTDNIVLTLNPLPFIAYHKIWDDWYRSPLIQRSIFSRPDGVYPSSGNAYWPSMLPFVTLSDYSASNYIINGGYVEYPGDCSFPDGKTLFDLRQRNFGFDYFTNAWPSPQLGDEASVGVDGDGEFTISQLRAANAIQLFRERNNIAGSKMVDVVKARYGADLSDGVAQRSLFLGSCVYDVYSKTVDVTANNDNNFVPEGARFIYGAGGQVGRAYANGNDIIIDNFTAKEPGYIFIMASLVPRATYGSGLSRMLTRYVSGPGSIGDMANPILQPVGNQPIYSYELNGLVQDDTAVFGYTDRFADWMIKSDEVHGLFANGNPLNYMAPQRSFNRPSDGPFIGSSFLEIPTTYLDGVTTVDSAISDFGYWLQVSFDYKSIMPLAQYSIPSLQDPASEHGETLMVHRGGFRL